MSYMEGKVIRLTIKLIMNLTMLLIKSAVLTCLTKTCEASKCGVVRVQP